MSTASVSYGGVKTSRHHQNNDIIDINIERNREKAANMA